MRAYVYQARSLIGSDDSGLSDPFARVIMGEYCKTTQVITIIIGVLEHIDDGVFSGSTLQKLDLAENSLTYDGLPLLSLQESTSLTDS